MTGFPGGRIAVAMRGSRTIDDECDASDVREARQLCASAMTSTAPLTSADEHDLSARDRSPEGDRHHDRATEEQAALRGAARMRLQAALCSSGFDHWSDPDLGSLCRTVSVRADSKQV